MLGSVFKLTCRATRVPLWFLQPAAMSAREMDALRAPFCASARKAREGPVLRAVRG